MIAPTAEVIEFTGFHGNMTKFDNRGSKAIREKERETLLGVSEARKDIPSDDGSGGDHNPLSL